MSSASCTSTWKRGTPPLRIDGYISKNAVRRWLENYQALESGDSIDDGVVVNTGPKNADGVSGRQLNKIMLDQEIGRLPDRMRLCVIVRWQKQLPIVEGLGYLAANGFTLKTWEYYDACEKALEQVYRGLNGGVRGVKLLLERLESLSVDNA